MTNHLASKSTRLQDRTIRASISFPEQHYAVLERIAVENRVSLAWVVRDAIDCYLKTKWPLLSLELTAGIEHQRDK